MTRAQAIAAARALLSAGLTLQDVAAYLRVHPRAVADLTASWARPIEKGSRPRAGFPFSGAALLFCACDSTPSLGVLRLTLGDLTTRVMVQELHQAVAPRAGRRRPDPSGHSGLPQSASPRCRRAARVAHTGPRARGPYFLAQGPPCLILHLHPTVAIESEP